MNANPDRTPACSPRTRAVEAPFAGLTPQGNQSMGFYIGTGDQDNYAKLVLTANGGSPGVQFVEEVGGAPTAASGRTAGTARPGCSRPLPHRRSHRGDRRGQLSRHVQRERGAADRAGHRTRFPRRGARTSRADSRSASSRRPPAGRRSPRRGRCSKPRGERPRADATVKHRFMVGVGGCCGVRRWRRVGSCWSGGVCTGVGGW